MKNTVLGVVTALLLSACSEEATIQMAALQGTVYEVGGQSIDLAGVEVTLLETGEFAFTDINGDFDFERLPPGTYRLEFAPQLASAQNEEEGEHDSDREVEVEIKRDGGDIEIRVAIEDDGRVKDVSSGDFEGRDAMSHLHPPEGSEVRVEGSIKLASTRHGERFEVAVFGLDAGTTIDICIGDDRAGSATADAEGVASFVRESGNLPLGKEHLEGLFGRRLEVKLEGVVILVGEIPDLPEDRRREEEGDDREGDGHEGDDREGDDREGDGHEGDGREGDDHGEGEGSDEGEGHGEGEDSGEGEGTK